MDESAGLTEAERQAPAVASRATPKVASWGALLTLPGLAQTPQPPSRAPQLCIATRRVSAVGQPWQIPPARELLWMEATLLIS